MTSCAVKWRHHVGFSPKSQNMFLSSILCCGVNMKSFASFKRKLWALTFFPVLIWRGIGKCYFTWFYLQWPTFDQSQFPNHLSYKGGWPLVGSAWGSSSLKSMFGGPISPHFCLHQHCLCKKGGNDVTWRKMTSSWQILTKLVESVSLIDINVWSIYEVIWII